MDLTNYYFLFEQVLVALSFLFSVSYVWLPVLLFFLFVTLWIEYLQTKVIYESGYVLLEIKLPKEIRKSPQAMELIFTQMYQKGSMTFLDTYWKGKVVPFYSLELVSIGGEVHFYIWTQPKMKNIIEAQLYSQYPSVEVFEVDDYTLPMKHDLSKMFMWGTHFKLSKADAFPIKTYFDYGLHDKATEEDQETIIDPMSSVVEYLGSLKKGEQCWIQILIKANRDYNITAGSIIKKPDWKEGVDVEIEKIMKKYRIDPKVGGVPPPFVEEDKELLKKLNASKSKYAFDTCIRGIYFAKNEVMDPANITGLIGSFRQYDDNVLNGFKLGKFTDFDYPWQDFKRKRRTSLEVSILDAYKRRSYFYGKYKNWAEKPFVLTTEELATIFHLPGGVVSTPTVGRIGSRKAEAPSNLPT